MDSDRRASAAWAARSRWPRRWPAPRCSPSNASRSRIEMRLRHALSRQRRPTVSTRRWRSSTQAARDRKPVSVGLLGNAAEIFPELVRRGVTPDVVTDQTSAHDPVNGYLPKGWTLAEWEAAREQRSEGGRQPPRENRWPSMCAPCSTFTAWAFRRSTTATTSARWRWRKASTDAFDFPGFVPAYIRPLFCRGIGPFRWVALSGDPEDIYKTDAKVKELLPDNERAAPLARHGARAHRLPGPAGAHLLGRSRRPPSARPRLQRDGGQRRTEGADRDRPRSSRFRLGRQSRTARPKR